MRVEAAVTCAMLLACAAPSPRRDLARVEDAARLPLPVAKVAGEVEPAPADVQQLLSQPLTADRAVQLALLQNRELRAILREVAVARGRAVQAGTLPNPTFQFDLRHRNVPNAGLQTDYLLEFDVSQVVLATLRGSEGEANVQAEQLRAAGAAVALGYRVRAAFRGWQAARQRWAVANRALDALAASRDAARALRAAGNVAELELSAEEAAYQAARAAAAKAELDVLTRREALQRLLGLHGPATAWTASDELPPPEPPAPDGDLEARTIQSSLALAEQRLRLVALARRTGATRAEGWLAGLKVDAHVANDQGEWQVGGGATVPLPVFDRRQGALAADEAEFDALLERYHGLAVDVRSAAREAHLMLQSSYEQARSYSEIIVPARRKVVSEALKQLNAMSINVFDLLRFQRELLDAELAAVDAQRDYWIARAAYEAMAAGGDAGVGGG